MGVAPLPEGVAGVPLPGGMAELATGTQAEVAVVGSVRWKGQKGEIGTGGVGLHVTGTQWDQHSGEEGVRTCLQLHHCSPSHFPAGTTKTGSAEGTLPFPEMEDGWGGDKIKI